MKRTKSTPKNTPVTPISTKWEQKQEKQGKKQSVSGSANRSTPAKKTGPHTKNRMKVRTYAIEYRSQNGKWPTYKMIKAKCRVGETVISEVMKELKRSKAA